LSTLSAKGLPKIATEAITRRRSSTAAIAAATSAAARHCGAVERAGPNV
jgi:hypothetical protein